MNDHRAAVTIRPFVDDDLADFVALAADPRVTRHVGDGRPWDSARATERARSASTGAGRWHSVVHDGRWAGIVTLEPTDAGETEFGIWIHPDHWGGGVATRAAAAAIAIHRSNTPESVAIAHVSPDNTGSRELMSRLGFRQAGRESSRYGTPVDRFTLAPPPGA